MLLSDLKIKIFADGADLEGMLKFHAYPYIKGFTTNPTLMRKSGITDYEGFARRVLEQITDRPISFEVFSDEFEEMGRQARKISTWGKNVFVKIPVTNTRGEFFGRIDTQPSVGGYSAECDRSGHARAGSRRLASLGRQSSILYLGFRGSYRRHRPRTRPPDEAGCANHGPISKSAADLVQPP